MRYHVVGLAGGVGWLTGLLFLIGLVLVIIWAVNTISAGRRAGGGGTTVTPAAPRDPARPTPNEILRERFAKGEMTADDFERAQQLLGPDK